MKTRRFFGFCALLLVSSAAVAQSTSQCEDQLETFVNLKMQVDRQYGGGNYNPPKAEVVSFYRNRAISDINKPGVTLSGAQEGLEWAKKEAAKRLGNRNYWPQEGPSMVAEAEYLLCLVQASTASSNIRKK